MPAWRKRLYWAAVGLLLLCFFIGCFLGVGNFWQWGHNGFNSAAHSQAARNSIRFGVVPQYPYYTGISPPGPNQLYTDHPILVHFHLIAFYGLFGFVEWAGRLVPALYSFLSLIMLFVLVRRVGGCAAALLSTCLYALTPLNLIFANMIDHEQGTVFWCLVFLIFYFRWLDGYRWRYALLCLLSISLAVQFGWPAYYFAFFVALHALATGLRRHPGWFRWRPEYTWLAIFSAVVLANFFGFLLWISSLRGGLGAMWGAFSWRSASQSGYLEVLWARALDLRGVLLIGLLGAWLLQLAWRLLRRRLQSTDLVPALFLLTQLVHSAVFQQGGKIHSYWTYYLGPAYAVSGALFILRSASFLTRTLDQLRSRASGPLRRLVPSLKILMLAGGAALLTYQAQFAWRQLRWGASTGSAAYVDNYQDHFAEARWAQQLGRHFARDSVHYLIHASVQRWRTEFRYYLDAPLSFQRELAIPDQFLRPEKHPVLLVDLNQLNQPGAMEKLARLTGQYRTWVWDRRFVALDAGEKASPPTAYLSRQLPASIWWRWLVNPDRPPIEWAPDPDPQAVASLFAPGPERFRSKIEGGGGGGRFEWVCSAGQIVERLWGQTVMRGRRPVVSSFKSECRTVPAEGLPAESTRLVLSPTIGPWLGRVSSAPRRAIACRPGDHPVGLFGRCGSLVDALGLLCAPVEAGPAAEDSGFQVTPAESYRTDPIGGSGGHAFEIRCPPGSVVAGFTGSASTWLHAVGIICIPCRPDL